YNKIKMEVIKMIKQQLVVGEIGKLQEELERLVSKIYSDVFKAYRNEKFGYLEDAMEELSSLEMKLLELNKIAIFVEELEVKND
ncbi:MAG: hypothetical protein QW575_07355, partial [Thermoproteota archaeon]